MEQSRPIGLFDSGIGGLTVLKEVRRLLPGESVLYFGDTAYVPYGPRPPAELVALGYRIIEFLAAMGAKYVIFACNTSSSVSLGILRHRFPLPMVGLVEPGAAAAVGVTRNGRVGILATEATVRAGAYERAIKRMAPEVEVFSQPAPRLVPIVEGGQMGTPAAREAVGEY
ncbi:MAG: glutamate racemase, partial [Firmicutes bacterium]|nr:glutamate racemase [Bacillota bacterium]